MVSVELQVLCSLTNDLQTTVSIWDVLRVKGWTKRIPPCTHHITFEAQTSYTAETQ